MSFEILQMLRHFLPRRSHEVGKILVGQLQYDNCAPRVVDAVVRLLPGALGSPESATEESHSAGLLEYPQYTRPAEFRGWRVPEVLLSGNHGAIARWRREQALRRTRERRPDLAPESPEPGEAAAILGPDSGYGGEEQGPAPGPARRRAPGTLPPGG